jgi:hypothetical protein
MWSDTELTKACSPFKRRDDCCASSFLEELIHSFQYRVVVRKKEIKKAKNR